jgi:hypothetical protein
MIAIVVMASASGLALLIDHGEQVRTVTKAVSGATKTVTVTKAAPQAAPASGATNPAESAIPDSTEAGFKVLWNDRLRLNETGYSLDGDNDPSPDPDSPNVQVDYSGNIDFESVIVAEWTRSGTPTPSDCEAQVKTQSFSDSEADSIYTKKGLQLCFTLTAEDKSTRVGYMRVRPGFTDVAVPVQGVLWEKL